MRRVWIVLGVAALTLVALLPAAWRTYRWIVTPGDPPAFYDPPAPLPAGPPGTVIRTEPVEHATARAWRVLHTTTDADGTPIAVSSVVIAPSGDAPADGWPVAAWSHGTSGVVPPCAPSLQDDAGLSRIPGLDQLLAAGIVVVATDYPGLGTPGTHPYLIGESEGRAVLDSARAANAVLDGATNPTTTIYGHSQGGHAALFATHLAPDYAPDLRLAGTAAMAPPTDLGQLLERDLDEPAGRILGALAIYSWSTLYPQADEDAVVTPVARPFVADIGDECILTDAEQFADVPDLLALTASFLSADPVTTPGWSELITANSLSGTTDLSTPLLIAQGLEDTIVRPPVTQAFVDQQCAAGTAIQFDTYATASHFSLRTIAAPDVVDWMVQRITAGTAPAPTGCTTTAR